MRKAIGLVVLIALAPLAASAEPFVAGTHYTVLDQPVDTATPSKIEVTVFFSYTCVHCAALASRERAWTKAQPNDVAVRRLQVVWNPTLHLFSEAFYVASDNDLETALNGLLLTYLFSLDPAPESFGKARTLFQGYGILGAYFADLDRMQFDPAYCERATREAGIDEEMDTWLAERVCGATDFDWELMKLGKKYKGKRLPDKQWLAELFALLGVTDFDQDRDEWIKPKISADLETMRRSGVTATPTIMVNGTYLVVPDNKTGVNRGNIFDVVDYLVDLERTARNRQD